MKPTECGHDIVLTGESGAQYTGKIYTDKNDTSTLAGKAIACLSNSSKVEGGWHHRINSIYNTENPTEELAHFRERDDISHLILIPYNTNQNSVTDKVNDLIRHYIHR